MNYTEPFVPTPEDIISTMLTLASVMPGETVLDLGSGDGRMVIAAARDFHARVVGVEVRRRLVIECRRKVKEMGLSHQVVILCRNFKTISLRKADVLAMYLSSYTLNLMAPKFLKELRPGVRIVNFDYPIPGWVPERRIEVTPAGWKKPRPIYLYVMGKRPVRQAARPAKAK
ncbi:MAG TPA: methyltransferase domain-containing protein [Nitrososphaerales archaeon]|nr:methyltransferase domain-containing protein [Nitrososphaerales archaeon]